MSQLTTQINSDRRAGLFDLGVDRVGFYRYESSLKDLYVQRGVVELVIALLSFVTTYSKGDLLFLFPRGALIDLPAAPPVRSLCSLFRGW